MAAQPKTQWGLFPPLSTALPTEAQLKQNDDMIEELKRNKNFESPAETQKRSEVLRTFQRAVVEFVKVIGKRKGMSDAQLKDAGGKVTTFGSFRLGAYGPGMLYSHCISDHANIKVRLGYRHLHRRSKVCLSQGLLRLLLDHPRASIR